MVILSNDHQNYILIQHFFEIIIDGVRKLRQENNNPRTFNNVKVWASRGRHGFPPADAYIKQLEYENIASTTTTTPSTIQFILLKTFSHTHN